MFSITFSCKLEFLIVFDWWNQEILKIFIPDMSLKMTDLRLQLHLPGASKSLQWCHNGHSGISNHQPHHCLRNRLFGHRSKKISKLRVTGLCAGNSPMTGEFPAQMASKAENVSIWWLHHVNSSPPSAAYMYQWTGSSLVQVAWTNPGRLSIKLLGTNLSEIQIKIQNFSFMKMHLKISPAKWLPFCLGLDVLMDGSCEGWIYLPGGPKLH